MTINEQVENVQAEVLGTTSIRITWDQFARTDVSESFEFAGVWTWFSNPRAISADGDQIVGSVDADGDVNANYISGGSEQSFTLKATLDVNDHSNPAFLRRVSDNRLMAWYVAHNGATIFQRASTNPDDPSAWGTEASLDADLGLDEYTYTNPIQLGGETNDPIYLFFRAESVGTRQFWYSKSTDDGSNWGTPVQLLSNNGDNANWPPYCHMVNNGDSRIDFVCTDGHPSGTATNSIYHFYYEGGQFRETDGTALTLPIDPATDLTPLHDGSTNNRAWNWHISIDGSGNPVIVYAAFPSTTDHRYFYARWNGSTWDVNEITSAGDYLYSGEPYYSGGLSVDPSDADTVWLSKKIDGLFQIHRAVTSDGGSSWTLTQWTDLDNAFRPVIIEGQGTEPKLAFVRGNYVSFTDYDTKIVLQGSAAADTLRTDGSWDDVKLLIRSGTEDDVSPSGRSLTWSNVSQEGNRIDLTNSAASITAPNSQDWRFLSGGTVELFGLRFASTSGNQTIIGRYDAAGNKRSWMLRLNSGSLDLFFSADGTTDTLVAQHALNPTVGVDYDVAFDLDDATDTVRLYVDGSMVDSDSFASSLNDSGDALYIGRRADFPNPFNGRIREIRITEGARYADDGGYAVPTAPVPTR